MAVASFPLLQLTCLYCSRLASGSRAHSLKSVDWWAWQPVSKHSTILRKVFDSQDKT